MKSRHFHSSAILHNKVLLYITFLFSLFYLLFLAFKSNYRCLSVFILVGFITSFFTKNMIIILFFAITMTGLIQLDMPIEGFEDNDNDNEKETDEKEKDKDIETYTNKDENDKTMWHWETKPEHNFIQVFDKDEYDKFCEENK